MATPSNPPADRGDATQPDPAMIEATAKALWLVQYADWPDISWEAEVENVRERYLVDARAAAGVIVAATAEHIAADLTTELRRLAVMLPEQADGLLKAASWVDLYMAQEFAAGLSAGATGGDSDE